MFNTIHSKHIYLGAGLFTLIAALSFFAVQAQDESQSLPLETPERNRIAELERTIENLKSEVQRLKDQQTNATRQPQSLPELSPPANQPMNPYQGSPNPTSAYPPSPTPAYVPPPTVNQPGYGPTPVPVQPGFEPTATLPSVPAPVPFGTPTFANPYAPASVPEFVAPPAYVVPQLPAQVWGPPIVNDCSYPVFDYPIFGGLQFQYFGRGGHHHHRHRRNHDDDDD